MSRKPVDTSALVRWPQCILSPDRLHRMCLSRAVANRGKVIVFIGVNPSKADQSVPDSTDKKWRVFGTLNGARIVLYVNLFTLRATDVSELGRTEVVNYSHADDWLQSAFSVADLIVPCWGSRSKIPKSLHGRIAEVEAMLKQQSAPVKVFGLTKSGDPMHPLMLAYTTSLKPWGKHDNP